MKAIVRTTDPIKLSALRAALIDGGIACEVFNSAAGALWRGVIPVRLMVDDADLARARRVLAAAGFRPARDGDWDL